MPSHEDTIVAVSSPPGRSARGLIRVSGPDVMAILGALLDAPSSTVEQLQAWPAPGRLVPCRVAMPSADGSQDNVLVLPAMVAMFFGPKSYTGQDTFELQCPGNPALLDRLIRRVVELGARLAEPGEFTFRAFLAGKLDLTQAEGVAATIAATNDNQLQAAAMLRQGQLGRFADGLSNLLADQLALVEAGIDFTDQDDVVPVGPDALRSELEALTGRLDDLLAHSRSWGVVEAVPLVVLAGAPSTGKSTLFNALLGKQRAVTAACAHTTRDVLTEPLTLETPDGQRCEVMLADLAGLDAPENLLSEQAQTQARQAIRQADAVVCVSDQEQCPDPSGIQTPPGVPMIRVRSKADLVARNQDAGSGGYDVALSAVTGQGLESLRKLITQQVARRGVNTSGEMLALQPRHEAALRGAREHLATACQLLVAQQGRRSIRQVELIAAVLRQGLDALGSLAGRLTPEDVLGRVFATFCIGK